MTIDEHPLGYHTDADPEIFRTVTATWHASIEGTHVYLWRSPGPDGPTVSAVHGFSPNTGGRITTVQKLTAYKAGEGLRVPPGAQEALLRALAEVHPHVLDTAADVDAMTSAAATMDEATDVIERQEATLDRLLAVVAHQTTVIERLTLLAASVQADAAQKVQVIDFQHPDPPATFGRTATWRGPTGG